MTKGRTVLMQKDKSKGNEASNYHPLGCLPVTWKQLAGIIVYRKAYDMVPHSWVINSLSMMCVGKNVVNLFGKMMKSWGVKLTCGVETLREVPMKQGIC